MEAPPVLESDGLEKLVLTRGLLTCCRTDILSCQLESFTHKVGELKPNGQGLREPLERGGSHWWGLWIPAGWSRAAPLHTSGPMHPAERGELARSLLFPKTSEWRFPSPGEPRSQAVPKVAPAQVKRQQRSPGVPAA